MIMLNHEQGSPEWLKSRAGVITASMFHVARGRVGGLTEQQARFVEAMKSGASEKDALTFAGYKAYPKSDAVTKALNGEKVGDFSEAAKNYAFGLAMERIGGEPLSGGFEPWQAKRGRELEWQARALHESRMSVMVDDAGFCVTEDRVFGATPDGLIGEDGLSEYKCFLSPEKLRAFWLENDPSGIMDQVQGQLWITGRKFAHIGMYCPLLKPVGKELWLQEFKRDESYIEQLENDLIEFKLLVDSYEKQLRA